MRTDMGTDILFAARQVSGKHKRRGFRLSDVSFELPRGYIMGVIGKNGAGKTTFFDYIMSARKRYTGEFLLDGKEIHEDHVRSLDEIGFISEANEFLDIRTAGQNADLLGPFYSRFDRELFGRALEGCKLSAKKNVGRMSRGEKMKFQLAFAVAHRPKLYLLDEATAGMDPVFRVDFYRLLHELIEREDCSVILSTHIEEEIEKQLDYVGLLEDGRFVSFGENALT